MKIDGQLEPLIRNALDAAIKKDMVRFDAALKAIPDQGGRDDATRAEVARILTVISAYVIVDIYGGRKANDQELHALAAKVAELEEAWSGLSKEAILDFMRVLMGGGDAAQLDPAGTVVMLFVVAASLLSVRRKPEGQWWFDYLDEVEAAVEASL